MKRWLLSGLISALAAPSAFAGGALEDCYASAENRIGVGACLEKRKPAADERLEEAFAGFLEQQRDLDGATRRAESAPAALRAQKAFAAYREAECESRKAAFASGTGSGDAYTACWIDLTEERAAGLLAQGSAKGGGDDEMSGGGGAIDGTMWLAEDIEGRGVMDRVRSTLAFEGERAYGSGGCNRFTGGVEIDGDELSFGPLASTRMMCPEPVMDQEMSFLQTLDKAKRFEIGDDGLLRLYGEGDEALLRFSRTDDVASRGR